LYCKNLTPDKGHYMYLANEDTYESIVNLIGEIFEFMNDFVGLNLVLKVTAPTQLAILSVQLAVYPGCASAIVRPDGERLKFKRS
jgi:hypothetical protein